MKPTIKKSAIKFATGLTLLTFIVGTVGALNGWFGGGGKIPEDTFTRGLVAYWSFDEGSGNIAYDASGNGNHGTIYGAKWTQGKIGGALSFDGVDDYVRVPDSDSLDITNAITIEAWVNCGSSPAGNLRSIVRKESTYALRFYSDGTLEGLVWIGGRYKSSGIVPASIAWVPNRWVHWTFTYDGSSMKIYKNGILVMGPTAQTGAIDKTTNDLGIGGTGTGAYPFIGLIDEVRIYNRALSPEEIRFHYSRGGPVAYWKFDEGQGTKVYDLSGNGNNGTLNLGTSGNTDPSKAWVPGKFGTALSFDGVDDYVNLPTSTLGNWNQLTYEVWVKAPQYTGSQWPAFIGSYTTGASYNINLGIWQNTGHLHLEVDTNVGNYPMEGQLSIPWNTWFHAALVYDGSTLKEYLNGQPGKSIPASGTLKSVSGLYIGQHSPGLGLFNGLIDEVRIYNYARTPDEIRLDYNAGYAARFGPSTDCNSDPGSCMTKGLVAYWSFDEGSGNIAYDSSGNGNHGTLINGPKWTQGKIGGALSFDGVNDLINFGSSVSLYPGTGSLTVEMWAYHRDYTYPRTTWNIGNSGGDITGSTGWCIGCSYDPTGIRIGFNDGTNIVRGTITCDAGYKPADIKGKWAHLVVVFNRDTGKAYAYINSVKQSGEVSISSVTGNIGPTTYPEITIGGVRGWYISGIVDEVRIYNRALSEEEIRYHYNHTLPKGALSPLAMKEDPSLVGYWSFNEGKGTIIYDQSGKNNNGTLYLGSSGNTDPSKAWSPGISGTALSFDGSDDYVDAGSGASLNIGNAITMEAWIYPKAGTEEYFITRRNSAGNQDRYRLGIFNGANKIDLYLLRSDNTIITNMGSASAPTLNQWNHIVATYDSATGIARIYLNGVKVAEQTGLSGTIGTDGGKLYIGCRTPTTYLFNGTIDEVRIYNRALSEQEILEHYRNSKYYLASHFGPKTNCREDPGSCIDYGLVGYWSFDEGAGTTAYDASGKGNNGTIYGAKWTNGKFGQALSFDGVDDYVEAPANSSFNSITNTLTICAWIYPKSDGGHIIDNINGSGGDGGWFLRYNYGNPTTITLEYWQNGASVATGAVTAGSFYQNNWYFVCGIIDTPRNQTLLYSNGTMVGSSSAAGQIGPHSDPLRISWSDWAAPPKRFNHRRSPHLQSGIV